jgi:hypothetical protein
MAAALLSGCAATRQTDDLLAAQKSGLIMTITDSTKISRFDGFCVLQEYSENSAYSACPNYQSMGRASVPKKDGSVTLYVSVESLRPIYKTDSYCSLGLVNTPCRRLHSRQLPQSFSDVFLMAAGFVTFSIALSETLDPEKLEKFVNDHYSEEERKKLINKDLVYRAQAPARALAKQREEEKQRLLEAAKRQAREVEYQQEVAKGKSIFERLSNEPRTVGKAVCDARDGFGYVERIAGDRLLISKKRVIEPKIVGDYGYFIGKISNVKYQDDGLRWVDASMWVHCGFN